MKVSPQERWKVYTGSVGKGRWRPPQTRQQMYGLLMRLGNLWYRLNQASLFWPPLIKVLKEIEQNVEQRLYTFEAALQYARPTIRRREGEGFHEAFFILLREIKTWEPSSQWHEAHLEIRIHEIGRCMVCGVDLKWPAYIEYAKGQRSRQIGVHCLESLVAKMEMFLVALKEEVHQQQMLQ